MTTKEFFEECSLHDWYYHQSDTHSIYLRGLNNERRLMAIAKGNALFEAILQAWSEYHFSGECFGKPQTPKPKIEDFE